LFPRLADAICSAGDSAVEDDRWSALCRLLDDGRVELDDHAIAWNSAGRKPPRYRKIIYGGSGDSRRCR